jgi:hypothetical protein
MQMCPDDRHFLTYERQDQLLREAAEDRVARLTPHGTRSTLRERVACTLVSLALMIAPSMDNVPHNSLVSSGNPDSSRRREECPSRPPMQPAARRAP